MSYWFDLGYITCLQNYTQVSWHELQNPTSSKEAAHAQRQKLHANYLHKLIVSKDGITQAFTKLIKWKSNTDELSGLWKVFKPISKTRYSTIGFSFYIYEKPGFWHLQGWLLMDWGFMDLLSNSSFGLGTSALQDAPSHHISSLSHQKQGSCPYQLQQRHNFPWFPAPA